MSKISKELRKVADEWDVTPLYKLADRIDVEMVELPKDKDGKPIHVGDTVFDRNGNKQVALIIELYGEEGPGWEVNTGYSASLSPSVLTHERPDSLERIADELDEMVDAAQSADDGCEKLADLADRIRRLAEREDKR